MSGPTEHAADTSVILTCYNERPFIIDAIQSVLAQTVADRIKEIIVVDDGSSDDSADAVEGLTRSEPKVRLVRTQNVGLPSARNLAIDEAVGAYVAILDGDDIWAPEKLERQLPLLDADPKVGLVYSDFYEFDDGFIDKLDRTYARRLTAGQPNQLARYYVFDAPIVPSSMVIRRRVFEDVGSFDPDFRIGEDTEMCLRIAERHQFDHVPLALVKKRRHASALTSRQDRLWPNYVRITEMYAQRNPALRPLAKRRLSRRAAKVAWGMIKIGDRRTGFSYLLRSFRSDPLHHHIYVYGALALVPHRLVQDTHRFLREFRQVFRARRAT